jgi:hypothetical protein
MKSMLASMMKAVSMALVMAVAACGDGEEVVKVSTSSSGLFSGFDYQGTFGWGTLAPNQTLSSTTGPGPAQGWAIRTCYTQALPAGVAFSCSSPAPGAIQMTVTNLTASWIVLGNRWHGATFYEINPGSPF